MTDKMVRAIIASELGAILDVVVSRKIGAPITMSLQ
jgi:hypothetical protein